MRTLNQSEIEAVSGGFVWTIPRIIVAAIGAAATTYDAIQDFAEGFEEGVKEAQSPPKK